MTRGTGESPIGEDVEDDWASRRQGDWVNLSDPLRAPTRLIYRIGMKGRRFLPKQECQAFGSSTANGLPRVEKVYVINLDRKEDRWLEMTRELRHVIDASGAELANIVERYPAVDAGTFARQPPGSKDANPFYTLGDQLLVEPQPHALPDRLELDRPIRMSRPEIAIALSHIGVWRRIAAGEHRMHSCSRTIPISNEDLVVT